MTNSEMQFKIQGMDCAEEVAILKREVGPLVGGEQHLAFDVLNGKLIVSEQKSATFDQIAAAVARTGMTASLWSDQNQTIEPSTWSVHGKSWLMGASGVATILGVISDGLVQGWSGIFGSEGLGVGEGVPIFARFWYLVAVVAGVWMVLPKAWFALRRLRPDMNLLMVVAVIGAVTIGEWFEAATVAFLFAVSLVLESWSVGRARRAVAALMDLAPSMAHIRDDAGERDVPPDQVALGTTFIVRPGEKLPLDGTIRSGISSVNQAPITGESAPVPKQPGEPVYAGTINGDGVLEVESTKPVSDTTLAQIVRMVGSAQAKRAPSEQWVERFAAIYTPVVMLLALTVLVIPPLTMGGEWSLWLYRALVLLVIACPCALVISTPVSIVAALASAASNGVLIKGGAFVEAPAHIKAICLDKTGTLTTGRPSVVKIVPLNGHSEQELLERAAALEANSTHPLAVAIVAHARSKGIVPSVATDLQAVQGKGVTVQFDGRPFWLGSHRYLEERGQETPDVHQELETLSADGKTIVVIGNEVHVCGLIALADTVRTDVATTLRDLKSLGVEHTIMLTGDNQGTASVVAKAVGIDEFRAELLPADKVAAVEELVRRYATVAMIGDGVNDAPALARATIGIAMGAIGTDVAIETADIALMADDLAKLPWLIRHARRALTIIRQNIGFALAVKAIVAALTLLEPVIDLCTVMG